MKQDAIVLSADCKLNLESYQRAIRFDSLDDSQEQALALFELARTHLQPKVLLKPLMIDTHEEVGDLPSVAIGSVRFVGKALAALKDIHRVIGYVATCGDELETYDLGELDMLAPYWLDELKTQALTSARKKLREFCREQYGITKPLSLNPGSGNVDIWPIEQMGGLFELLGGTQGIGVKLTESALMIPNKTIAGLLFASSLTDYESCAYCEREQCPNRRVPFKERL